MSVSRDLFNLSAVATAVGVAAYYLGRHQEQQQQQQGDESDTSNQDCVGGVCAIKKKTNQKQKQKQNQESLDSDSLEKPIVSQSTNTPITQPQQTNSNYCHSTINGNNDNNNSNNNNNNNINNNTDSNNNTNHSSNNTADSSLEIKQEAYDPTQDAKYQKHAKFEGRLLMIGFGSIGRGVIPLIFRHLHIQSHQVTIISPEADGAPLAAYFGATYIQEAITRDNYESLIRSRLGKGDFLLNLSVDVSSLDLMLLCHDLGALYLDTCIEPWRGGYTDTSLDASHRSNYCLREQMLQLRRKLGSDGPTMVVCHGANPGLVSHLTKQALLNIANDVLPQQQQQQQVVREPTNRREWAELAQQLGVKVIHIAERDCQIPKVPKPHGVFVNTWSVDGFISEGLQPAELGWGTHEKQLPTDGERHKYGCQAAIYLNRPGAATRVRTWTPQEGPFWAYLITHNEAISIADYLTVTQLNTEEAVYRPTVHYAYHPSDGTIMSIHEMSGKTFAEPQHKKLLGPQDLVSGIDELGVLLMGHARGAYWFGSQLSIEEAKQLIQFNSATTLQVTVSVLGGLIWALENPNVGIVEADDMNYRRVIEVCKPYLGPVVGAYSDWNPLQNRAVLFDEELDKEDPWQFTNFRVHS